MKKKKVPMNSLLPGRYGRMTCEEWDREVEKFDKENIADFAEPLDKELKERLQRATRRGRPPIGKGAKRVLVTIERDLLSESDAYAKAHGLTRAAVIAQGLKKLLKKAS